MSLEPGTVVRGPRDEYQVVSPLGRGGFAVTVKAVRRSDGVAVALKMLRLDRVDDWKAVELFERESAVLRQLSHPHIPQYLDDFTLGDPHQPEGFALVQQLIEGVDLATVMRGERRLSAEEMGSWFRQMLEVLAHLHSLHPPVIHRDITPKNILLGAEGAFLVDFGTVQAALRSTATVGSTAAGTFGYAPMEQFVGRASPSSNLYGLGMTYLAVASGAQPEEMPLDGTRVNVRELLGQSHPQLDLLEAMTDSDPRTRLGDARRALAELDAPSGNARTATPTVSAADWRAALEQRLREAGFTLEPTNTVGRMQATLVAHRAGSRNQPPIKLVLATREQLRVGETLTISAMTSFALEARNAEPSRGLQGLLGAPTVVVPVVVSTAGAVEPGELPSALFSRRPGVVVQPVLIDWGGGSVHVVRAPWTPPGIAEQLWWLLTPRKDRGPAPRAPSALVRLALAVGAAALLLFGGAFAYVFAIAPSTYYLVWTADPDTGRIALSRFQPRGDELDDNQLTVLDTSGTVLAHHDFDPRAYLCGLDGDDVNYWSNTSSGASLLLRTSLVGKRSTDVLLPLDFQRWWWCGLKGDRLAVAYGESGATQIFIHGRGGQRDLLTGTEPNDQNPTWLPDGKLLVSGGETKSERLIRIDPATGERSPLGGAEGRQVRPAISPNGSQIAFYSITRQALGESDRKALTDEYDLALMNASTGETRLLIQAVCFTSPPAWASDHEIIYGKWTGESCGLFVYDLTTDATRLLVKKY